MTCVVIQYVDATLGKMAEIFRNVLYLKCFWQGVRKFCSFCFCFFLAALGGVQKGNRSFHFSSCTSWSQRKLGNDIGIQIIHCSKFFPTSKYIYYLCCFFLWRRTCTRKFFFPLSDKFLDLRDTISGNAWYDTWKFSGLANLQILDLHLSWGSTRFTPGHSGNYHQCFRHGTNQILRFFMVQRLVDWYLWLLWL